MTELPAIKTPASERDSWELRALKVFTRAYAEQQGRILPILLKADRDDILRLIGELFDGESDEVQAAVASFMDDLAEAVSAAAFVEAGVSADPDTVILAINQLVDETARIFATTMSENSRRLTFSIAESWLQTPGATVGDLRKRMRRVWKGPRPDAAATTETTRLVARTRLTSWQASGVIWGYDVRTKNDDRVREDHRLIAAAGPYRLDDLRGMPPINGDINCRCVISPVVEDPNG